MAQHHHVTGNEARDRAIQLNGLVYGDIYMPNSDTSDLCLRDLSRIDPREDKARLEDSKDEIVEECYSWVLKEPEFLGWKNSRQSGTLWIKGGPGKGKTMMMLALADQLTNEFAPKVERFFKRWFSQPQKKVGVAYFYCESGFPERNSAVNVLSGLIYLLARQSPSIMDKVRSKHEENGKRMFNDMYRMRALMQEVLLDETFDEIYFLVDALDECLFGLRELLNMIGDKKLEKGPAKIKWLLTSRERDDIERGLKLRSPRTVVLDSKQVDAAVLTFIRFKIRQLQQIQSYDADLKEQVEEKLRERAQGTFLWVALACKRLAKVLPYKTLDELEKLPPGLELLYDRMMEQLLSPAEEETAEDVESCKEILKSVTVAYRPLHLTELASVANLPAALLRDTHSLEQLIVRCGSFLSEKKGIVSFFHLSAKDYFVSGKGNDIFDSVTPVEKDHDVASRCMVVMSDSLKMDMTNLKKPAAPKDSAVNGVEKILHLGYACCYWAHHLARSLSGQHENAGILTDGGEVHGFLRKHLVHWLEALSILGKLHEAILVVEKLQSVANEGSELHSLLIDTYRFILANFSVIDSTPLQVYSSALVFAPRNSVVREQFNTPAWIKKKPEGRQDWSSLLQVLELPEGYVTDLKYSPDSNQLAVATHLSAVFLWDAVSGAKLRTLAGHNSAVLSVAYSPDSKTLVSAASDTCLRTWDVRVWESSPQVLALKTFDKQTDADLGDASFTRDEQFAQDMIKMAEFGAATFDVGKDALKSQGIDITIEDTLEGFDNKMNNISEEQERQMELKLAQGFMTMLQDRTSDHLGCVTFSPDGTQLVAAVGKNIKIWRAATGEVIQVLIGHSMDVISLSISPDGKRIATSAAFENTPKLWDVASGKCLNFLEGHTKRVFEVAFSPDGKLIASASSDSTVKLWNSETGKVVDTLDLGTGEVGCVKFTPDGKLLAAYSSSWVYFWNPLDSSLIHRFKPHENDIVGYLAFSPDGKRLATSPVFKSIVKVWDMSLLGSMEPESEGHSKGVRSLSWSPDHTQLASASIDTTVKLWDFKTRKVIRTFENPKYPAECASFSSDGKILAWGGGKEATLSDTATGERLHTLTGHAVVDLNFTPDGKKLVSLGSYWDNDTQLWDPATGAELENPHEYFNMVDKIAISPDSTKYVSFGSRDFNVYSFAGKKLLQEAGFMGLKSMAFSPDGKMLIGSLDSPYDGKWLGTWDATSGELLHEIDTNWAAERLAYDRDDPTLLETNRGMVSIASPSKPTIVVKDRWVTYGGEKILWLPAEYRADCVAAHGNTLVLGHSSGEISFFELDLEALAVKDEDRSDSAVRGD